MTWFLVFFCLVVFSLCIVFARLMQMKNIGMDFYNSA